MTEVNKSIQVEIDSEFSFLNVNTVTSILSQTLIGEESDSWEITVIFGDDSLLSNLKKKFFNMEQLTDIIAFRLNDYSETKVEGEIYISVPRAKENAKNFNEPFKREMGRLIIHGGLHLLNYNDKTVNEKKRMYRKENEYLKKINWKGLYCD